MKTDPYRSAQHHGVVFVSDGPQLVAQPPGLQLADCPLPGGPVLVCGRWLVLVVGQQVRQRALFAHGLWGLHPVRV